MHEPHANYIAGEWVHGESKIENRSPSDPTDLVGRYTSIKTAYIAAGEPA